MDRIRQISDYRIKYTSSRAKYRNKNVELRIIIDRTVMPYGSSNSECNDLSDGIWKIFIEETNFIQFEFHAPEAISGGFKEFEESNLSGDEFEVTLNYADYGKDLSSTHAIKTFVRSFRIDRANEKFEKDRKRFWQDVRIKISDIIDEELYGKPGRTRQMKL